MESSVLHDAMGDVLCDSSVPVALCVNIAGFRCCICTIEITPHLCYVLRIFPCYCELNGHAGVEVLGRRAQNGSSRSYVPAILGYYYAVFLNSGGGSFHRNRT